MLSGILYSKGTRRIKKGDATSILPLILSILTLSCALHASPASRNVFRQAERYTVRVHSSTIVALEGARRGSQEGSGFVVHIDRSHSIAYIATNKHVIDEGISFIQVNFKDGERFPAKAIYIDPVYDFGMLAIKLDEVGVPDDIESAELGRSGDVEVGHRVGTFGNPQFLEYCATEGIISSVTNSPYGFDGAFLQTDAPINPGNSGGPLISLETGKVVGINTAVTVNSEGIGWSLAADQLKLIIKEVIQGKLPYAGHMAWLGTCIEEINIDRAKQSFGASFDSEPVRKALLVVDVYPQSPAEEAGFESGDIICSVDGNVPRDNADLLSMMRSLAGKSCKVELCRFGERLEVELKTLDRGALRPKEYVTFAGMVIQPTSPCVYENFTSVYSTDCVFISDVLEGSSAQAWGAYKGYPVRGVLVRLKYYPVHTLDDFWTAIRDVAPGEPVELFEGRVDYGWIVKVAYYYTNEAPQRLNVEE